MQVDQQEIETVRHGSRVFVRELGLLEGNPELTLTQSHVLIELGRLGVLNIKELAEILHMDSSTMSRTIKKMAYLGWVEPRTDESDKRARLLALTPEGQTKLAEIHKIANARVGAALDLLNDKERKTVAEGLLLYGKALARARMLRDFEIRLIAPEDNPYIANIIRTVLAEFGADGPGFAYVDPEIDRMYETYDTSRAAFHIVTRGNKIVGGGGIGPLKGADSTYCELQKMYLLPEARGYGIGAKVLSMSLEAARSFGYKFCYLETIPRMYKARELYESFGFRALDKPLGDTGHHACHSWMIKDL